MAACAGLADAEPSFPERLGHLAASRVPGTQRDAVAALQLCTERQPGIEPRLRQLQAVRDGLKAAAGSSDAKASEGAAVLLKAMGL